MNITSRSDFESIVPSSSIADVARLCNGSLANNSPCASCTTGLSRLKAAYLPGPEIGNVSDCASYPSIYAAAAVNRFGPSDPGTALCLFLLNPPPNSSSFHNSSSSGSNNGWIAGVVLGVLVFVVALVLGFWFLLGRKKKKRKRKFVNSGGPATEAAAVVGVSTNFVKFTFEEIKSITRNFSRDNIIGWGGYGNVYRGLLPDGSEVALKRFKNCAASGMRHSCTRWSGGGAPTPGSLVAEWAWDLVRNEKALDVIESGMEDLGPPEVMEKYVLVGVLASHPQVHARPTMDHIVKMLEIGGTMAVPVIPDRPISLIAGIEDIEKSMSSSGSGQLSSYAGCQPFTPGNTDLSST
ncbi:putative LRR receptor-like serine/threonine-protein kinase RKF3 [Acorus calamus]|uniref:LRR receptor-like serine/threonine-protein kinase RKF3 n=1 Tax=Acorus calamus TaxID=4465 RepID=A0AAV9EUP0_ACOCL|nr:putative LRR receptor-like serine/threonine-protein kinase RKF3 [Acorus calamus]